MWGPIETSGVEWSPEGVVWGEVGPSRVEWAAWGVVGLSGAGERLGMYWSLIKNSKSSHIEYIFGPEK